MWPTSISVRLASAGKMPLQDGNYDGAFLVCVFDQLGGLFGDFVGVHARKFLFENDESARRRELHDFGFELAFLVNVDVIEAFAVFGFVVANGFGAAAVG